MGLMQMSFVPSDGNLCVLDGTTFHSMGVREHVWVVSLVSRLIFW
jgi:hypothetical protein